MPKRQVIGVVTSDRMDKTRRVEIGRLVRHPKYGKFMRRRTVCHVHDEQNTSKMGDTVEIVECPPKSRTKRWELLRVVAESQLVDLAAMRAAQKMEAEQEGKEGAAERPSSAPGGHSAEGASHDGPSPEGDG
jgi:small subunit ribosomal protein S17